MEDNSSIVEKGIELVTDTFSGIISNIVVAAIIIFIGFIVGRLLGKFVQVLLKEISLDENIKKYIRIKIQLEEGIGLLISYSIYLISIIMGLNHIGLTAHILNIISSVVIIVVILSLFIGLKDIIPNIISGLIINNKKIFNKGDEVIIDDIEGIVENIKLTETIVITKSGDLIYIPNRNVIKNKIIKHKKK
jgi:small-conductance mechanosensitive channel